MNPEETNPSPTNPPEDKSKPVEAKHSPLKQIRTFQGDVAAVLNAQNESLASIQMKEQALRDAHRAFSSPKPEQIQAPIQETAIQNNFPSRPVPVVIAPPAPIVPRSSPEEIQEDESSDKKILWLVFGTIILITIAGFLGWYAYSGYKEKSALPKVELVPNRFIASQSIVNINAGTLSREAFIDTILAEREKEISAGRIIQIELLKGSGTTTAYSSSSDLLNILNSKAPGSLVRAFNPLFMIGLLGTSKDTASSSPVHTFILIQLDSFENAFPGMLAWETSLTDDLLPLFAEPSRVSGIPSQTRFQDVTIQNKDARVLKDPYGETVLLYAFFDNKMLIITDNENSLRTIIGQLNSQKLSR